MSKRRKWSSLTLSPFAAIMVGILSAMAVLSAATVEGSYTFPLLGLAVLEVFCFLWGWWSYHQKYSVIFLKRRIEAPSFWVRNRDQVAINVIIAIVSSVLAFLATLAATRH